MDVGMTELLLIGIVALIVIGPRDLPEMFRQLGRFTAKIRSMSREFSRAMEAAANESGMKDVARDLKAVTDPKATGLNAVKDAVDKFEKWDPIKNAARPTQPLTSSTIKPLNPPPMPPTPAPAAAVAEPVAEAAAPVVGPNTAALFEKKAAKAAILREATEKLKAVDAGEIPAAESPATPAAQPDPKPRAPRKKKAAEA
jgi:sec-independent protein translocase protein TatB